MKYTLIFGFLLFTISIGAQKPKEVPDTLVKLGGKKILAYIKNVTTTAVYYVLPEKPTMSLTMDRKDLEKAIYKNGKVEIFNKPAFTIIQEGQWEAVLITKNEKDIEGMYKRKFITARSSPNKSKKKAKENAVIKMQKQAANAGGSIIFITHDEFFGGYGDIPGYYLEGYAYGFEPLDEGTNVVDDPSKKDDKKNGVTNNQKNSTSNKSVDSPKSSSSKK